MNNFIATIGIEVHTELNTQTKMFSSSVASSYDEVNTNINEIDLGLPGVMPSPNKQAIIKGIQLAKALNMTVDTNLCFDRKNYFYQDLPKGFQITQQYHPIGKNGHIKISNKTIRIERIHLEEDTAKQQVINNMLCLDYNRCGIPLIEIVSQPEIHSATEAVEYLNALKRILTFLNISDGKMEDGSFRADINISIAPQGSIEFGTKVEIKNLNSFVAVGKAIDYEYQRQVRLLLNNELVKQETRRWDDQKNQTIFMREKSDSVDYHYFREPNIVNIKIDQLVSEAIASMRQLPERVQTELQQQNIQPNIIEYLLDNFDAYKIFKIVNERINCPQIATTWVVVELASLLKTNRQSYDALSEEFVRRFIELLQLLIKQEINGKQAKTLLEKLLSTNKNASDLILELGFKQITDEKIIKEYLIKYVNENETMLKQYSERPERVEKFFVGLLMKDTKGQANPNIAIKVLREILNN